MAWFRSRAAQILHEILAGEAARLAEARKIELEYARLEAEMKLKAKELRNQRRVGRPPGRPPIDKRSLFDKAG